MSDATANVFAAVFLAVIPGFLLAVGVVITLRRKRR